MSAIFDGEEWPIYFRLGKGEGGYDMDTIRAPFSIVVFNGIQYICTSGWQANPGTALNSADWERELKYRAPFGPQCVGKMLITGEHEWGDGKDCMIGMHRLSFV